MFVKAAREKKWFRELLEDVMKELERGLMLPETEGSMSARSSKDKKEKPEFGRKYSRFQIRNMLGGGHLRDYLPSRNCEILCGCFNLSPNLNPGALNYVLYGKGPRVESEAVMVHQQNRTIPISFVTQGSINRVRG